VTLGAIVTVAGASLLIAVVALAVVAVAPPASDVVSGDVPRRQLRRIYVGGSLERKERLP
jgi:hypothetical protein